MSPTATSLIAAWSCILTAEDSTTPSPMHVAQSGLGAVPVAPAAPASAAVVFGEGLGLAVRYAELLADAGVIRGLIGPRETPRLWDRHLLNSAVVEELLPACARVVDVGTGAGLPGLALACARRDLRIDLVDTLRRRTDFLHEAVELLGVGDRVRVVTGRAEDRIVAASVGSADWVVARAVAPLDRLARWCLPLLNVGGTLLAMKGARAQDEMKEHRRVIQRLGGSIDAMAVCGVDRIAEPARVVVVHRR